MAHSNSALSQWSLIKPAGGDSPAIAVDLNAVIDAVERQSWMWFATRSARDAAISSPVNGMVTAILGTVNEIDMRLGGAWVKIYPNYYVGSGSGAPSGSIGVINDIYFQT
jgi:hypothetical protein